MDRNLRIAKLKEVQTHEPLMSGVNIPYKGSPMRFNAYLIPLENLVYNKYNGRIGTRVRTYEKEHGPLNPEELSDVEVIERFLWESHEVQNKNTVDDLLEKHQQRPGIVTSHGIIVDGNRRASLLNRIYRNRSEYERQKINVDHAQYLLAVILPEDADQKEILKLETEYQMGEDPKAEYNPIEKYLKCNQLKEAGFSETDIAKMMHQKSATIMEWLEVMDLMESYLSYLGYEGIYTRLDHTEDHFLGLNKALKSLREHRVRSNNWIYDDLDVAGLQQIAFDYIRARYEGKEFRSLFQGKGNLFNTNEETWQSFAERHHRIREKACAEEVPVEELREENPDIDISQLLEERDKAWGEKINDQMESNLGNHVFKNKSEEEADRPKELAEKAMTALEAVDTDAARFASAEVKDLLLSIQTRVEELLEEHANKAIDVAYEATIVADDD